MIGPDILVAGAGRSGTSAVARVLEARFGVCFGHHGVGELFRGETVYEDQRLKASLKLVVQGRAPLRNFLEDFDAVHHEAGCEAALHGVKLLNLALLEREQILELDAPLLIWAWRPRDSCVDSWCRYNGGTRARNEAFVDRRLKKLERTVAELEGRVNVVRVNFYPEDHRLSDDAIANSFAFDVGVLSPSP